MTFSSSNMQINARLKKNVIEELTMNPDQTNIEIGVMLGVPEKDVQKIREEIAEKAEQPAPAKKKTTRRRQADRRAAASKEKFEAEKAAVQPPIKDLDDAKFYLRTETGIVRQLVRRNSSQSIVLLEEAPAKTREVGA